MIPVLTPEQMREVDARADTPVEVLIDRAGWAVAHSALRLLGGGYGRIVNIVAGPGNNGADGRVAGKRLRERGVSVRVFDALDCPDVLPSADLVVDAAFGSGFRGSWRMPDIGNTPILAVDVPTGLDGATGEAESSTRRASATVTFCAPSPGQFLNDGPGLVGELTVADIGLDAGTTSTHLVEGADIAAWVPRRGRDAHKWVHGVRIVAGSIGMTGAAGLAAAAALRGGSGMVAVSSPGTESAVPTEAVERRVPPFDWADAVLSDLHRFQALVLGPGLGREEHTVPSLVRTVLESVVPIVVDGDGLFALSWNEDGDPSFLIEREVATVLTPHDGEFGLLTGHRPGTDRIADAHRLAEMTGATVLLKGPTTVVAAPDGRTYLVANGTERLATAGTGDVLSGLIGAFLAAGTPAPEAAAAGAWVHAESAAIASAGMIAGDLLTTIPLVIEQGRNA